jgi:hypothetical protein
MPEPMSDYSAQINQEIKDKKLNSKDNEYYRLKMLERYHRLLKQKSECPTCGKMLSLRVLQAKHKCKNTIQPPPPTPLIET